MVFSIFNYVVPISRKLLKTHLETHDYTVKWMCSQCTKGYKTHSVLAKHDYLKHEHGQFECGNEQCGNEQCGFVGETRIKVQLHQEREHRGRIYRCQFDGCLKSFPTDALLATHERIHLATKPYKCSWPECDFASALRGNVTAHIRVMHFKLPVTVKEQKNLGIVDQRNPDDYIEVDQEQLACRLQ